MGPRTHIGQGRPFIIYGLICPKTLEVKYVGQTVDLWRRTAGRRSHGREPGAVKEWLDSLGGYLRPVHVILERGINRTIRLNGGGDVWLSSICEAKWLKRFRRTVLNADRKEIVRVWDVLKNPPLPWYEDPCTPAENDAGTPA
jgi:hypothetical protein